MLVISLSEKNPILFQETLAKSLETRLWWVIVELALMFIFKLFETICRRFFHFILLKFLAFQVTTQISLSAYREGLFCEEFRIGPV
jgi:hypothetical protein